MGRSLNKDSEASTASIPERRSLRHSKPVEEDVKPKASVKGRKSIGKKREEKVTKKSDEKLEKKPEDEGSEDQAVDGKSQANSDIDGETSNTKPVARRSGRKRQLSEEADPEEEEDIEKEDDKSDDQKAESSMDETIDEVTDKNQDENNEENKDQTKDEKEETGTKETSAPKNGLEVGSSKGKARKKRKPPTKKKKEEPDESEMWTPLEPLDGDEKKESQRKPQAKSDRRKQALIERQAPAEPMLQKQLPRQRRNSDTSECEVLGSVPRTQRRPKTIVTVDIDDEASETGSIQIVAEPENYVFDFKRLLIQYRNVNLPSPLWGAHKDPRNNFISFTRFNPDYPDINGLMVDRAVVFKGSLNHEVFVNGEKIEPPAMFNDAAETLLEIAQIIEFVNNTISSPVSQQANEPVDISCSG